MQGCTLPILCLLSVGVAVRSRDAVVEELEGLYLLIYLKSWDSVCISYDLIFFFFKCCITHLDVCVCISKRKLNKL